MVLLLVFSLLLGVSNKVSPLPPILFLLIIEGLSLLSKDAHRKGLIKCMKISSSLVLTHLFFVDNVVLFGVRTLEEWKDFDEILAVFSSASGMCISVEKSFFCSVE